MSTIRLWTMNRKKQRYSATIIKYRLKYISFVKWFNLFGFVLQYIFFFALYTYLLFIHFRDTILVLKFHIYIIYFFLLSKSYVM